jgi:hypothetical protein
MFSFIHSPTFQLYMAMRHPSDPSVTPAARAAAELIRNTIGLPVVAETLRALQHRPIQSPGLVALSESITRDYTRPRRWGPPK